MKNKQDLFLMGIMARYRQNIDYFISIEIIIGDISEIYTDNIEDAIEKFTKNNISTLLYRERGTLITIIKTENNISMKQSEENYAQSPKTHRKYIIDSVHARDLLFNIGILTNDGKIKNDMIRKYNQIDHYVELVAPLFASSKDEEIVLMDCGCGKSYLSFVLNYYFREVLKRKCRIIGIDYTQNVIDKSKAMAEKLGYHNMEFIKADLNNYIYPKKITAVITLHACDTATDLAIAMAIKSNAKFIAVVPCCHKELIEQINVPNLEEILKYGILKARMSDLITDGLRAIKLENYGFNVRMLEYISPLDTPKNLLILGEKTGKIKNIEKYNNLKNLLNTNSTLDKLLD